MASYFIESQCEASDDDTQEFSELSQAEWDEAMRQSEAQRSGQVGAAAPRVLPAGAERYAPLVPQPVVERRHTGLGRLARAAAAASPVVAAGLGDVPEFPAGLVEAEEDTSKKVTRVVFTINNPGDFVPVFSTKMAYLVWQLERGKEGTEHIQGYCRFKGQCRLRTVVGLLGGHCHVLIARGNEQQCRDYCTKEDTRVAAGEEHGEFNPHAGEQGRRSDLLAIAKLCSDGIPLRDIAKAHPSAMIRFPQGIANLHQLLAPAAPIQRQVDVQVFWGPSGTGKTHRVRTCERLLRTGGIYVVKPGRGPWDRYQGETTILFDEFDWTKWEIFEMNQYLDKWDCPLSCRFHDKSAAWTLVVICSNSSPTTWWSNAGIEVLLAIRRRFAHGCRWVTSKLPEEATEYLPWFTGAQSVPDFSPEDGRDVLLMHPRAQEPSTRTSSDAPAAAAAAASDAPQAAWSDVPSSQPPSPLPAMRL